MDEKELMNEFINQADETFENSTDENVVNTTLVRDYPEANSESSDENYVFEEIQDDFVYNENDEDTVELNDVQKKSALIQKPVLIACSIFLCLIIVFGVFILYSNLFGNNNFFGTWVHQQEASADEATKGHEGNGVTYFTFERNGKATMTMGNMVVTGEWTYNANDNSQIDVNIYYFFGGTFSIDVKGNIFTGRTMELKDTTYGSSYNFISTSIPDMHADKKENAKIDEKLVGTWTNEEKSITYAFNSDGTYSLESGGVIRIDGVYYTKDNKVITTYISNEKTETKCEYKINKDNTATIADLEYKKQN